MQFFSSQSDPVYYIKWALSILNRYALYLFCTAKTIIEPSITEDLEDSEALDQLRDHVRDHHARLYRKRGMNKRFPKHPSVSKFFGHRQVCYI